MRKKKIQEIIVIVICPKLSLVKRPTNQPTKRPRDGVQGNPLYSQEVDCALPPVFLCRIEDEAVLVPRFATFNAISRRRFCSLSVIFGASSFLDRHGRKRTGTIWKHICLLHFVLQKLISNHIISKTTLPSFSNR